MKARRDDCIIIASLAPQDPQVVHARPLDVFFADGLRGPAFMTCEAPRRLGGALGEALVVVRLAEEAVAVPVGALVHCVFGMELLPWCHGGGGCPAWVCALTRKALDAAHVVVPAIIRCPIILAASPHSGANSD